MFKLFITVSLLLLVLNANKHLDTHSILAEIDRDKFGGTMLSMIALNLAAKAENDEISLLLDQMIK